jgi:hypothetical protein
MALGMFMLLSAPFGDFSGALAAVPVTINVQGKLTDAAGVPLAAGNKTLSFKIYDDQVASDGQMWPTACVESQVVATGADGLLTVSLGVDCPLNDANFAYPNPWLEVTVDAGAGPVVLPRVFMNSSPYTFRVATVDEASGGDIRSG